MRRNNYEITVTGSGHFPIDMLRYSQCYPRDIETVDAIQPDHAMDTSYYRKTRSGVVCMDNVAYGAAINCVRRFLSFGWSAEITSPIALNGTDL